MEQDKDGYWVLNGGQYESPQEAHHFETLGLCGCGFPELVYNLARDVLTTADRRPNRERPDLPWKHWGSEVKALLARDPDVAAELIMHLLDGRGLVEHGTYVGGSWLTPLGEEIVDLPPRLVLED